MTLNFTSFLSWLNLAQKIIWIHLTYSWSYVHCKGNRNDYLLFRLRSDIAVIEVLQSTLEFSKVKNNWNHKLLIPLHVLLSTLKSSRTLYYLGILWYWICFTKFIWIKNFKRSATFIKNICCANVSLNSLDSCP